MAAWLASEPLFELLPTDVGHYPNARWHFVERVEGISQSVLIYCVDGAGWVRIGSGEVLPVGTGEVVLTPPGQPHAYGAAEADPWTIYWIHLDGPKVGSVARILELDDVEPILRPGRDPSLPVLFEKLLAILVDGYTSDNLLSASMSLGQLIAHLRMIRHRQPNSADGHLDQRVKRVIDAMHGNITGHFRVEDLAREANLSASHLAAVFKRRTGFTVIDFFNRLKIQRACFLLDTTDLTIKLIASELGFDDALYFSRYFRRIHACSPTQYRAMRKG